MLIVDEYPVWGHDKKKPMSGEHLEEEFRRWMRERWNHASVVMWDAQNESGPAGVVAGKVRDLDLSDRPWDTGWSFSGKETDPIEAHPYSIRYITPGPGDDEILQQAEIPRDSAVKYRQPEYLEKHGGLAIFETFGPDPFEMPFTWEGKYGKGKPNPILINEYARLCWLRRDGRPASGCAGLFARLGIDPQKAPVEVIRETAAYFLAAQTEFWRHGRGCAAVQHFVALTADGQKTADNFIELEGLKWDPYFERYMPDAFGPTSIMIDLWDEAVPAGQEKEITLSLINDLVHVEEPWQSEVTLVIYNAEKEKISEEVVAGPAVVSNGKEEMTQKLLMPERPGRYELHAVVKAPGGEEILSRRRLNVLPPEEI